MDYVNIALYLRNILFAGIVIVCHFCFFSYFIKLKSLKKQLALVLIVLALERITFWSGISFLSVVGDNSSIAGRVVRKA